MVAAIIRFTMLPSYPSEKLNPDSLDLIERNLINCNSLWTWPWKSQQHRNDWMPLSLEGRPAFASGLKLNDLRFAEPWLRLKY
jgi:hypothetical protein